MLLQITQPTAINLLDGNGAVHYGVGQVDIANAAVAHQVVASGKATYVNAADSRKVATVARGTLPADLATMGVAVPMFRAGLLFVLFNGLTFSGGGSGAFTLAAPLMSSIAVIPKLLAYLPANAGGSGCAAGWYYATMSTTTAGIIYNNTYVPAYGSEPRWPEMMVEFSGSPTGAVTQSTSEITAALVAIPAGSVGANGRITISRKFMGASSANNKEVRIRVNGNLSHFFAITTQPDFSGDWVMQAAGSQTSQISTRASELEGITVTTGSSVYDVSAENLAAAADVAVTMRAATNAESFAMQVRHISLCYGA